jgi:hypothetical protein
VYIVLNIVGIVFEYCSYCLHQISNEAAWLAIQPDSLTGGTGWAGAQWDAAAGAPTAR